MQCVIVKKCKHCFCRKCCELHDQLFSKHVKYEIGNLKNWPVSKELEAVLQMCEIHTTKQLERFCNDHYQLCCSKCASLSHRKCKKVTFDSAKKHRTDVNELFMKLRINILKLKKLQRCCESGIQDLDSSYKGQKILVQKMNKKINATMDKLLRSTLKKTAKDEQNMVKQLHESIHSTLNDIEKNTLDETKRTRLSLQTSLKTSVEKCILYQNELKILNELLLYSSHKEKKKLCFLACRKCIDKIQQVKSYMENNWVEIECSLLNQIIKDTEQYIFQVSGLWRSVESIKPKTDIEQYLSKLSGLARIVCNNYVFTMSWISEYKFRAPRDSKKCIISAISALPDGQILVLDTYNSQVNLLDKQFQLGSHYTIDAVPRGVEKGEMCKITPSEVALTLGNSDIHFIKVTRGQLVAGRRIQLQHKCIGITHHRGDLFITSNTALYKHSLSGRQISKLYEDKSGYLTMWKCAVSPTGDKLYIIKCDENKLLTLASDGTVLATFRNPDLQYHCAIHVTPAGQLLVGYESRIIQLHSDGNRKLATLATLREMDSKWGSVSVCYNSTTSSIIVGRQSNSILVFKVK